MIGIEEFTAGLVRLGVALRQPPDEATIEVYFEALAPETDAPEWDRFTRAAAVSPPWLRDGRAWFPQVVEFVDALRQFRGSTSLQAEALVAYERVFKAGEYTAEGGTTWTFRAVFRACGRAAAEAFLLAGGHHAFATSWDETRRRSRFVEGYVRAARENPAHRLIAPAEPVAALPAAASPSREEAARLVAEIARRAPAPKPRKAMTEADWDARRAELLRRAAEAESMAK